MHPDSRSSEKALSNINVFERECAGAVSTGSCGFPSSSMPTPAKALVTQIQARRYAPTSRRCLLDSPPDRSVGQRPETNSEKSKDEVRRNQKGR
ncbi:hypothetical protein CGRA01v4_04970 [Colletotrichum graminicola]|nr:hypothetical protein CGRA01v4_04970 [Colletotrichum graminicola]